MAASILTAAYYMIRNGTQYGDLGVDYFQRQDRSRIARRLTSRLRQMGYQVQLKEGAA